MYEENVYNMRKNLKSHMKFWVDWKFCKNLWAKLENTCKMKIPALGRENTMDLEKTEQQEIKLPTSTGLSEKAMVSHSSTLAWKIPWTEEPGRLWSMGSLRVRHDWATSLSLFIFMHWWRKWQPTPVFLPGESQGWGNLVGCRLWGHTESDMTKVT